MTEQTGQVRESWDGSKGSQDKTNDHQRSDLSVLKGKGEPNEELEDGEGTNDVGSTIDWDTTAAVFDVTFEHMFVSFVMHIFIIIFVINQLNLIALQIY